MNRRTFLHSASIPLVSTILRGPVQGYSMALDPIGEFDPIVRRKHLRNPVIIESLELYEKNGNWFIRARSKDGAEGWSVGHPKKMKLSQLVFTKVIAPYMQNKDARDLDLLVDRVFLSDSNYKMQGQLFWVAVAAAEFAILDLLGKVAKCSVVELLGGQRRKQVDLYVANNHRTKDVQESLRRIIQSIEGIDAKALKLKIGGRMKLVDAVPGRTEELIPMVAKALGDKCTLYADANSSYLSVNKAIQVGKILEENAFSFYEEPVPFDYLNETKRVAEALEIPVAWGEQESSQWRFKWMVENSGVRIFQPDLFYYGGLIRSLRVAKMAEAKGFDCTPHISGGGLGFLYMGIYASCSPNPGPFQEYKGLTTDFPWESTGDKITIKNGSMSTPNGNGIGVDIDSDYLAKANRVK
ncbi:MAG: mandelate racemase/muconate lactonizing enzyme family protein [Verrucomicrobiota bacterium]|nr:mandelate racemase/muconate lactonizing enzyme family protein [Verrucomicrobiota bacterium]MEE2615530.1 mandelate racemase/muconate lactonizing enzyme family protein [Verrucomicrobiota bacterium]